MNTPYRGRDEKPQLTDSSAQSGKKPSSWAIWKHFNLSNRKGGVYLRRLRIIQTPLFGVYLHHIDAPDPDPHPHDHPWPFWSLVLKGSYIENRYDTRYKGQNENFPIKHLVLGARRRWSFKKMPLHEAHKIEVVHTGGVVTLMFVGRRVREWGFWESGAWIPWKEYLENHYGGIRQAGA